MAMPLRTVDAGFLAWAPERRQAEGRAWCQALETGEILYFAASPLALSAEDVAFLLRQKQASGPHH